MGDISQTHTAGPAALRPEGMLASCFTPFDVQGLACEAPPRITSLSLVFAKSAYQLWRPRRLRRSHRSADRSSGRPPRQTGCHATARRARVFFRHTQRNACCVHRRTQVSHVGDRDATVFRDHERLSFGGEAGHLRYDRFFLTAIKTQGLLLHIAHSGSALGALLLQRPTVSERSFHLQRDRHLRWPLRIKRTAAHQRSWMARAASAYAGPPRRTSSSTSRFLAITLRWSACRRERRRPWSRHGHLAQVQTLAGSRLGLVQRIDQRRGLPWSLSLSNERRPMVLCTIPALSTRNCTWPALAFFTRRGHVGRHCTNLEGWASGRGAQDLAQAYPPRASRQEQQSTTSRHVTGLDHG